MAETIVEKIFSKKCSREIRAGDMIMAPVDAAMIHDITGPLAIEKFREMGGDRVFDPKKIIMIFDHQIPADSISAAKFQAYMREFAKEQGIHNYDIREGVCHQVTIEKGHATPGDLIVGSDSHTCMYGATGAFSTGIGSTDMGFVLRFGALYFKALEFTGDTISAMDMPGRMTCCNMAIEMGAKAGIVPPDATTWDYLKGRTERKPFELMSDNDAEYSEWLNFDVTDLEPQVAVPHNVDNVVNVTKVEGTPLQMRQKCSETKNSATTSVSLPSLHQEMNT